MPSVLYPASTNVTSPVIPDARSEHKNAAVLPTSSIVTLRRSVTIDEVGNTAAFLCSDLASGITGEVTFVDAGYNTLGMTGI